MTKEEREKLRDLCERAKCGWELYPNMPMWFHIANDPEQTKAVNKIFVLGQSAISSIPKLLNALDEAEKEIAILEDVRDTLKGNFKGLSIDYLKLKEENERLRELVINAAEDGISVELLDAAKALKGE